jgi:hypothetical protein
MVREIRGAKINPKSLFKIRMLKIRRDGNYARKYGIWTINCCSNKYTYISDWGHSRCCGYRKDICLAFDQLHVAVPRIVLLLSNFGCSECIKVFWAIQACPTLLWFVIPRCTGKYLVTST